MRKFIGEQRTNLNPTKWFNVWKHLGKKVLGSNFVEITITHEHKSAGTKFFFYLPLKNIRPRMKYVFDQAVI